MAKKEHYGMRLLRNIPASVLLVFATPAAMAQSFTVHDGETVGARIMNNAGDAGAVLSGGAIEITGLSETGVSMLGAFQDFAIDAGGELRATGNGAFGVFSQGPNARIVNRGAMALAGDSASAIVSTGDDVTIENDGSIALTGAVLTVGITALGANAVISNTGSVETSGLAGFAILSAGPNADIRNSGSIVTHGDAAFAIVADGDGATIANSGYIGSEGLASGSVIAGGDGVLIVNSGVIEAAGSAAIGIATAGAGATIVNSGGIFVDLFDAAIIANGANSTIVLQAGTAIQGGIAFGGPNGALVIGDGLNTALTFAVPPAFLDTSGNPFAISGATLAVVDPTSVDAEIAGMDQFVSTMVDAVGHRVKESRGDRIWMKAIGALQGRTGALSDVRFHNALAGLATGRDWTIDPAIEIGLFAAAAKTSATTSGSQALDSTTGMFGTRLRWQENGAFAEMMAYVGGGAFSSDRRIANNTVLGGVEHAIADFGGLSWGAAASLGKTIDTERWLLTPSLRARYAGFLADAFSESGSAANLIVDQRSASVFELRAQMAFSGPARTTEGGRLTWGGRVGVENAWTGRGAVNAELLTQPILLAAGDTASVLRGFAGLDAVFVADAGYDVSGAIEFGLDQTGGASTSFGLQLKRRF